MPRVVMRRCHRWAHPPPTPAVADSPRHLRSWMPRRAGCVPGDRGLPTQGILDAAERGSLDVLFLLGFDAVDLAPAPHTCVVYQGHHGDRGAALADVVLPGCAYTEKTATYTNTEGRRGQTLRAANPPGASEEDWRIVARLAHMVGCEIPFEDASALKRHLERTLASVERAPAGSFPAVSELGIQADPLVYAFNNFYMTDVISRNSPTMALCVQAQQTKKATQATHVLRGGRR